MADFLGIALLSAVTLPALGRLVALDRDLLLAHLTADLLLRDGQLAQARSLGTARLYSIEVLHESYGDSKYRPCPLLKKMVDAGLHGRESGRRFYAHLAATAQEGGGIGHHDRFGDHGDRLLRPGEDRGGVAPPRDEPMAEIVDKQDLLEKIRPFSPLRRVLLATPGTLQATLSAFFGTAIGVRVKRQQEAAGTLLRTVSLVLPDLELEVCSASTKARVTDPQMRRLLWERTLGIGRIAAMLGASASFRLDDAGEDTATFWRVYQLWGAGFHYRIREAFPGSLYPDGVRWDVARLEDVLRNVPTI